MDLTEKTVSQKYAYKGRIVNLRLDEAALPNGKIVGREVVEHPGGVCVAALTDDRDLLLVRQYRYPYGKALLEVPAGKLERGEDPEACGLRELEEETGARAARVELLCEVYPTPGYCAEVIRVYGASGLTFGEQRPDEDEFLECERVPLTEALRMVEAGEIADAKTQIAVLRLARKLGL